MKNLSQKINDLHLKDFNTSSNDVFNFESFKSSVKSVQMSDLQQTREKLNTVCMEFDPFIPVISDEILPLLAEFRLMDLTKSPFEFTNTLLRVLTIVETEIKSRLH